MYHAVRVASGPDPSLANEDATYTLDYEQFCQQMELIQAAGKQGVKLDALLNGEVAPENAVIITFDDGHVSNAATALPVLQRFQFTADFFITTDWIDSPHYLSSEQILELHQSGMGIGSHSCSHVYMDALNAAALAHETANSAKALSAIIGQPIDHFSAPGGRTSAALSPALDKAGYRTLMLSNYGYFRAGSALHGIPRLAIKSSTSAELFKRFIRCEKSAIFKYQATYRLRSMIRTMIGNDTYLALRKRLLAKT